MPRVSRWEPLVFPAELAGIASGRAGKPRTRRTATATARLVADDQVIVTNRDGRLIARAPAAIDGKLEVRGLGIIEVVPAGETELRLVVDLVDPGLVARMPPDGETGLINAIIGKPFDFDQVSEVIARMFEAPKETAEPEPALIA